MKQNPSQLKFKKYHRISSSVLILKEQKCFFPFHEYGLKFMEPAHLTFSQIEACRKVIKRGVRNGGFFNLDVFCFYPVTEKTVASRMGKGKGNFKR
jgi:large subunit ribosomal protein L16